MKPVLLKPKTAKTHLNMQKFTLLIITGIIATSVSISANAQSTFEGAYGQVGIGYQIMDPLANSATITTGGATYPLYNGYKDSSDFTGTVTLGYMGSLSNNFLLGVGAEYSPIAGSSTALSYAGGGLTSSTSQYKFQNCYNLFVSPAYAVDVDKLVYGKLGYTGATTQISFSGSNNPSTNFTGYSLGIGYKQMISGGWYGFIEGNYFVYGNQTVNMNGVNNAVPYTSTSTVNAKFYNALVGIGYRF